MILLKVLEFDLHRNRAGSDAVPRSIFVPARAGFLPAVVSDERGSFFICKVLFGDDWKRAKPDQDGYLPSGVFPYDSDALDDLIDPLFGTAFNLSHEESWPNILTGKGCVDAAFSYVQKQSGTKSQPHCCLVPRDWNPDRLSDFFGKDLDADRMRFRKTCVVLPCKIQYPVFLSRPDYVGQVTQFLGGRTSVVLHNVKLGMAFPVQ